MRLGRKPLCWKTLCAFIVLLAGSAQGAVVTAEDVLTSIESGTASVSVVLANEPGDNIGSLQFDMDYDPGVLSIAPDTDIVAGQAALDAGKTLDAYPVDGDTFRVLIFGINQDAMGDGVIAEMTFGIGSDALTGTYPLLFTELLVAAVSGTEVPSTAQDGSVYIDGIDLFAVSASVVGQGAVYWTPTGSPLEEGTEVSITADPALGWEFSHWQGSLTGDDPVITVVLDSDLTFEAVFEVLPLSFQWRLLFPVLVAVGLGRLCRGRLWE